MAALIHLATIEAPVVGEPGKVFSTAPEVAIGVDGQTYYIKGKNGLAAFSEVVGCRLASLVGLKAPRADLGIFDGGVYAAVESVPDANRAIRPWLLEPQQPRINNRGDLFDVIAVDTWLVNDDRNMGNLVGSSLGDGRIDVFMIDFEKSRTLGVNPFTSSSNVNPSQLWPVGELGMILRQSAPRRCSNGILDRIREVSASQLLEVMLPVVRHLTTVTWHEDSVEILKRRAERIDALVESVWATK